MKGMKGLRLLGLISILTGGGGFREGPPSDELRGIDLEKEWELIKQKKSKLSARQRFLVKLKMEEKDGE